MIVWLFVRIPAKFLANPFKKITSARTNTFKTYEQITTDSLTMVQFENVPAKAF